jgi:ComF family protein
MLNFIKELLFPKICLSCGKFGKYICSNCQTSLSCFSYPVCFYCEKQSINGKTHEQCKSPYRSVDQFITIYHYAAVLKKVIANIKYRLVSDAFNDLFRLVDFTYQKSLFFDTQQPFLVQPIPLHRNRQKERGFNQSELIAEWLSKKLPSTQVAFLERQKETKTQAKLSRAERLKNAQNAFKLKKGAKVKGNSFILVDDVVTTGSTVNEAATVLKAGGAAWIGVFSIAKD